MHLTPKELDKLLISQVGIVAQRRLARGVKLNRVEAIGLISFVLLELVRDGDYSVVELMELGKRILGVRHVMLEVPENIHEIQLESTFPDGSFLITVHEPISNIDGDLDLALYGSFLPKPDEQKYFPIPKSTEGGNENLEPYILAEDKIVCNVNRDRIKLTVINLGDRPIQVGSHYHFIETNSSLKFDRFKSYGYRLDIAAGTSVRFEPGDKRQVQLCKIGGNQVVSGGNNLASGKYDINSLERIKKNILDRGFGHMEEQVQTDGISPFSLDRKTYVSMFGPTTKDKVRLGDTNLYVEVEYDHTVYGDESKFGGGKVLREGMGQSTYAISSNAVDTVITNCLILDYTGIYKADIGIKNGIISAIGKSGNPDVQDNVNVVVGVTTEAIAGEGLIITAGGIDTHIHFICPQLADEALSSGITTFIGGGTGPATGTNATTCTSGPNHIHNMFLATDNIPLNLGFTGKGNCADVEGLKEQIEAGAIGLKLHEDWGTTPAAIDACLKVCDLYDVQTTIHTDTLNESGYVESTLQAIAGRTIHTYHSEGAGGGHAPDILKVCSLPNVVPSSTNPTRPYTTNTLDEHVDMLMVCHHLSKNIPEDVAFAESRIRGETIAAEDVLHDTGAISIISSDSQAMGRVGEVISRTWKTAHKMKLQRGHLNQNNEVNMEEQNDSDNFRVKSAIAHGIAHKFGSIEVGKIADLVLFQPYLFGTKPELVLKAGQIVYGIMGDPNASIPTCQPLIGRKMFFNPETAYLFVSKISLENDAFKQIQKKLKKKVIPVENCRQTGKKYMKLNDQMPKIQVDPETYQVYTDGNLCTCLPAGKDVNMTLPLNQKHYMF